MPKKPLITVEEIIEAHKRIINRYGGESGILNKGELEFIVDWINSHPKKSIFWKVAILLRGIVCGHPFVDGNKRTAFEVADSLLRLKGYKISASDEDIIRFLVSLAMKCMSIEEIIAWLNEEYKKDLNDCIIHRLMAVKPKETKKKRRIPKDFFEALENSMRERDRLLKELAKL
jgi:death-on-curing protein